MSEHAKHFHIHEQNQPPKQQEETEAQGGSSDLLSLTKLGSQGQNLNDGF